MLDVIARITNRRPLALVVGAFVVAAICGIFGAPVTASLTGGNPDFVTPGSESVRADERIEEASGIVSDGGILALVDLEAAVDTAQARTRVQEVAEVMAADPTFAVVRTYYSDGDPSLVSEDGRSTYVVGLLRSGADDDFQNAVDRLSEEFRDNPDVALGGSEVVGNQVVSTVQRDLARAELLAFPLLFVLSLWIFRSVVASALPLVIGGLNIVVTLLGLRVVNEFTDLSIFGLNLVTALGLGLAIDYSLLVVSRFRGELASGSNVDDAITVTVATAGRTILFSSLTVGSAMASLFLFDQRFLFSMAVGGVMVALSSALVALLALPAMLRLLGRHVDFLAPPRWRRELESPESTSGGWFRLASGVMRRAPAVAVAASALLIVLGLPFLGVEFTAVGPKDLPTTASSRAVDDRLGTSFAGNPRESVQVVVEAPLEDAAAVERLRGTLAGLPGASSVGPPQSLDAGTWLLQVDPVDAGMSDQSQDLVQRIRDLDAGYPVLVGGETASFLDLTSSLAGKIPWALAIVCLASMVLLAVMTGSAVLPVKAVIMNLLTLSATYGILVLIFQDGHLTGLIGHSAQGALDATQPILLFALVFGLSTDYGVFLLARIKEARDAGAGDREAVVLGVGRTGRIVTAAAILFCVALGALATSQIVFIKELGIGTALGVLIDATIVRALLVPALMALLGGWNWWAPAPLRRAHERFGRERLPPQSRQLPSQMHSPPGQALPAPADPARPLSRHF